MYFSEGSLFIGSTNETILGRGSMKTTITNYVSNEPGGGGGVAFVVGPLFVASLNVIDYETRPILKKCDTKNFIILVNYNARLGFHAVPSMAQVHLHVISQVRYFKKFQCFLSSYLFGII